MPDDRSLLLDFSPRPAPTAAPAAAAAPPAEPSVLSVGALSRAIRDAVDRTFAGTVWVEGEIAGAKPSPNGHFYFSLKDDREEASIDVVVYRSNVTPRMRTLCVDGGRLRLRGRPAYWMPRGRLQFVADRAQAVGRGALLEALERLKAKLAAEGLFAPERRRALPAEPRVVGVVTSAGGAAIHDICRVAFRRGGARILLAPAQVQGAGAGDSIVRAIVQLSRVAEVDVVIVGRGGGSSDDLNAFNEEAVVRAVVACRVPVVSAVGHEVDVTLVDFAADARAATPSQAAEMAVPDRSARAELLARTRLHLAKAMRSRMMEDHVALGRFSRRLGDPRLAIAAHQQLLDDRRSRLASAIRSTVRRRRDGLAKVEHRLALAHPRASLTRQGAELAQWTLRLSAACRAWIGRRQREVQHTTVRLEALNPLSALSRGYAIVTRDDGRAVRGAEDVARGDVVHVRVRDARFDSRVESVAPLHAPAGAPADGPESPPGGGTS